MSRNRPPRPYDPTVGAEIVARIEAGEELRGLWRDPTLPGRFTLKRWRHEVPAFSHAVRAAVNRARSRVRLAKSSYGPRHRRAVCRGVAAGRTLDEIAARPGMPGLWAIKHWLNTEPKFRLAYAKARDAYVLAQAAEAADFREHWGIERPGYLHRPPSAEVTDQRRLSRRHRRHHLWLEGDRTAYCPCVDCQAYLAHCRKVAEASQARERARKAAGRMW